MSDTVSESVKEKITLKIVLVAIAGCLIYGILTGFRSDMSAIIGIIANSGDVFSYVELQTANTVCRFVSALAAPFIAFLTLKKSNFFVLTFGFVTSILGLLCIAVATSFPVLVLGLGILFAVGTAALSFGIIFGIVSAFVGEKTAVTISTIFSLATTFFGILFSPVIQRLSDLFGYQAMLFIFTALLVCIYPLIFVISGKKKEVTLMKQKKEMKFRDALSLIFRNKITYILMAFFFVMGFSSGINNHFYTGMLSLDVPSMGVSFSFSLLKLISAGGMVVMTLLVIRIKRPVQFSALVFLLFGVLLGLQLFVPSDSLYFLIFTNMAVFVMAAFYPVSTLIVRREFAPILLASLFCFLGVFSKIGSGINSVLGGVIYDIYGAFDVLVVIESSMTILFAVVLTIYFVWKLRSEKKNAKN
ncbi:MAG TPA: hypothetical protein O0X27_00235 [Methanocorpusculum sp.]|nr:hypothetical protein [Methanocorpusculum sp.]